MKAKNEKNKESDEAATAKKIKSVPIMEAVSDDNGSSELNEPRWSVISFEKREASGLTYDEAARKMNKLAKKEIPGLCIVTDEAAEKI